MTGTENVDRGADEPVSLAPLTTEQALRALLAVKPEADDDAEDPAEK